jgi:hypothetical protein
MTSVDGADLVALLAVANRYGQALFRLRNHFGTRPIAEVIAAQITDAEADALAQAIDAATDFADALQTILVSLHPELRRELDPTDWAPTVADVISTLERVTRARRKPSEHEMLRMSSQLLHLAQWSAWFDAFFQLQPETMVHSGLGPDLEDAAGGLSTTDLGAAIASHARHRHTAMTHQDRLEVASGLLTLGAPGEWLSALDEARSGWDLKSQD